MSSSQQSNTPNKSSNNIPIIIGIAIGTFLGGISLSFGGFFLYKWNKNKKRIKRAIPIPGNEEVNDTDNEVLEIPTVNNNYGQEIISTNAYERKMLPPVAENENSTNNKIYNHGREVSSAGPSLQNMNVEKFKNEMHQVIKQEIMQDLKQELGQIKKQVSNANINK